MNTNLNERGLNKQRETVKIGSKEYIFEYEDVSKGIIKSVYDGKDKIETIYEDGRLKLNKIGGKNFLEDKALLEDLYLSKRIYDFESETWIETEFKYLWLEKVSNYLFVMDRAEIFIKRIYDFTTKKWLYAENDRLDASEDYGGDVHIYDRTGLWAYRVYYVKEQVWKKERVDFGH